MRARRGFGVQDERGVALVMAIVVLLVISLLATAVMQNLSTQRKISGHGLRTSRALSAAEAGVAEMLSRMRSGEITLDELEPASAVQIFLVPAGQAPAVGADTTAYATVQPSGEWLDYSSSSRGPDVLTLGFRRDDAGRIVRWDDEQSTALNTACGMPVYSVTSTGKINGDRTRIRTEFFWKPHHLTFNAAICSGVDVILEGTMSVCGYQHEAATDYTDAELGRSGSPSCTEHEVGIGNLPGVWTAGTLSNNGVQVTGIPSPTIESQGGFYDGPWEPLGMTPAELTRLLGTHTTAPSSWDGMVWLDDDATFANGTRAYAIDNLSGTGVLYVDGDLELTGTVAYRGLVYVAGDFSSTAGGALVGGLIVHGASGGSCALSNGPSVVYSRDAVNEALGRAAREIVTLSWREVR
ncbi:MAG: PilX N-terminal domain-containing pilus assembly protein [Candidatus Eisenbacteria bacterium]